MTAGADSVFFFFVAVVVAAGADMFLLFFGLVMVVLALVTMTAAIMMSHIFSSFLIFRQPAPLRGARPGRRISLWLKVFLKFFRINYNYLIVLSCWQAPAVAITGQQI